MGCTWERAEKFTTGDLAECDESKAAFDSFMHWFVESKYDNEHHAEYKGWPFQKVRGSNDKDVVVRDDLAGGAAKCTL